MASLGKVTLDPTTFLLAIPVVRRDRFNPAEIWVTTKLWDRFYGIGEEEILKRVQQWLKDLKV